MAIVPSRADDDAVDDADNATEWEEGEREWVKHKVYNQLDANGCISVQLDVCLCVSV